MNKAASFATIGIGIYMNDPHLVEILATRTVLFYHARNSIVLTNGTMLLKKLSFVCAVP